MNVNETIQNTTSVKCPSCSNLAFDSEIVCSQCSYPFKGTEKDQKDFLFNREMRSADLYGYTKELKKASTQLYYIAVILVISGLFLYVRSQDSPDAVYGLIVSLLLAMVFVGLGAYCHKRPMLCVLTGLVLFSVLVIGDAILDPSSIVRGLIFKIAGIVFLINGLKSARQVEKIRAEDPYL